MSLSHTLNFKILIDILVERASGRTKIRGLELETQDLLTIVGTIEAMAESGFMDGSIQRDSKEKPRGSWRGVKTRDRVRMKRHAVVINAGW